MKNLLLLSNSTLKGDPYFQWPLPYVQAFCERLNIKKVAFVPFAAVTFSFDEYTSILQKATKSIGLEIIGVHNNVNALAEADAVAVGGGNTFALLKRTYEAGLVQKIRDKVNNGVPYMGWSAGSNMACPYVFTTNDMPIVEPPSFNALNLIPFQINPHYTNMVLKGHGGESRDTRINEFTAINNLNVAAIPEGSLIEVAGSKIAYKGAGQLKHFKQGQQPKLYTQTDDISFLLK
ncbi:MAG: dipeptidase PepE [Bacteroidia bacterium]